MTDQAFPSHASVVVIGGGIMGCSTLYHLAKLGVTDALLLERDKLTSGTTWHSAAQVRALRSTRNLTDLIRYSISLYSDLERETGQSTGWINKGSLSIATNRDRLVHIKRQEALAHLFGVSAVSISADEAKERWPLMNANDVIGAVWSPEDGRVSPSDLCAALVKGAKSRGASIFEDTAVTAILTKNGKVFALETIRGRIRCDAVALCAGLWSRETAASGGVELPIWPCEHFYLLTQPITGTTGNLPTLSDHDGHLYIRDDSGGLLVGCFEPGAKALSMQQIEGLTPFQLLDEDWDHFEPMMKNALHRLPCLEDAGVKMLLNGPESFTPDGSFILGESAETQGLFLGCGMNSVGVATGGGAGMALAHCILQGHTPTDLHEVDPKRFPACFNSAAALTERIPEVLGEHYAIHYPGYHWSTARNLRKTPEHEKWVQTKAHFGQFYGWERPLYFGKSKEPVLTFGWPEWFSQVGQEVKTAHESAAIFDQSSFGKISVTGPDAEKFLNRVCANDMTQPPGRAIYTAMLNERGGYESDLTALRLGNESYRLYVGTSVIARDMAWLNRHLLVDEKVDISDVTEHYAVFGLMGPKSESIAQQLGALELISLPYFNHTELEIADMCVRGTRLSYVGEAGWEITCKNEHSREVYRLLYESGARPAGLFAQSSMRIEKRFLSFGHELDTEINPLQAGLGFTVDWDSRFVGRDALIAQRGKKLEFIIVTILFDDIRTVGSLCVPLGNEPIYHGGEIVGKTTSAAYGYRVAKYIALGIVNSDMASDLEGMGVRVNVAGEMLTGHILTKAAFDPGGNRMKVFQRSGH